MTTLAKTTIELQKQAPLPYYDGKHSDIVAED